MNQAMTERRPALRMAPEHTFRFRCAPGLSCFTQCCGDVTVVLTPYDVLRMKRGLGTPSDEFLERYAIVVPKPKRLLPMVVLKMNETDKKCPFVTQAGCMIYRDRPWPCRMFPLNTEGDGAFSLVPNADRCRGLEQPDPWKIGEWLKSQGILPYEEMNELLSSITIPLQVHEGEIENPQVAQMVFMSLYNLDRFRDFVFKSSFLDRFTLEDPQRIDVIRTDDEELLRFAMDWVKFGVFGEKLFWVKESARGSR